MISKYFVRIFLNLYALIQLVNARPEKPDCDWVPAGQVVRMRDLLDCTKFYYCIKGQTPYRASCPTDPLFTTLYFEPNSTHCDLVSRAPKSCFGGGSPRRTSTTKAPTTTTKPVRPPLLDDKPDFEIDCSRKGCGVFPNTYGACNTFIICVNGNKLVKKCHGGQLFDAKTKECQPASQARCWKEPTAGPYTRNKLEKECPFHGKTPSMSVEARNDGIILQNPVVTNWGTWQRWTECPKGTYVTGIYAWRRLLMQGSQMDHVGILSLSFLCQTPGGTETNKQIESLAPGAPRDGWPFYYMCKGAVVGIRLNSVKQHGWGRDELATDNVQAMCSCSTPAYKPYEQPKYQAQSGNRGVWTTPQYCERGQAVCGMQTQMHDYKEHLLGTYDNTGLNNMKVKCCNVPDPLNKCVPKESRILVRVCNNSRSEEGLRCDFNAMVGLSLNYDVNLKLIDFYTSIGYTFDAAKLNTSRHIASKLGEQMKEGKKLEYDWNEISPGVMEDMKVKAKNLYVKAFETLELHQIVGMCEYFLVRTNRFVRVVKDEANVSKENLFEI